MLTHMKQSLDKVSDKLTGIDSSMENFEVQQKLLEEELKDFKSSGKPIHKNWERIVPPALAVIHFSMYLVYTYIFTQSQVWRIHNSLDEEKQFKVNEP